MKLSRVFGHASLVFFLLLTHCPYLVKADKSVDCYDELQSASDKLLMVHLFEWRWEDIAKECENYIQHTGIGAIQVSPPNEHVVFEHDGDHPWWLRYQPVSYKLESRSGTRQQFIDMVNRCHKVGIKIIVDVVLNHMTGAFLIGHGSGGSYFNGTPFMESYPAVPYTSEDFNDQICNHEIQNFNDQWEVRNCRLSGLLDLKLSSPNVQQKVAAYMNDFIDIGVAGFRMDASKHVYPEHIKQVLRLVKNLNPAFYPPGKCPFLFHEVIDNGYHEVIPATEYTPFGRITNFRYGTDLSAAVKRWKNFQYFGNFGEGWAYWPDHDAVVFVDNHDNQRGDEGLVVTFKERDLYIMANAFMLAWPYGIPSLMSSFQFSNRDMGPPSSGQPDFTTLSPKFTANGECEQSSGWVCEHRWPSIRRMTLFRKSVHSVPVENLITENHRIAFSRGDKGFFALNNDPTLPWIGLFKTGLDPGLYCDMISGEVENGKCDGRLIVVNADGTTELFLEPETVMALSSISIVPIGSSFKRTAVLIHRATTFGEDVFIKGGVRFLNQTDCQKQTANGLCSVPIIHYQPFDPFYSQLFDWKKGYALLDWYDEYEVQDSSFHALPLAWTTNDPSSPHFYPLNRYGSHYWVLDVFMDCSKVEDGWFEFKAYVNNKIEGKLNQQFCTEAERRVGVPYRSNNHIARCGHVNVYNFNESTCISVDF